MDILFTDLDNTLIYSKKIDIEDKISVEIYDGDDNSFMSRYSYELLHRLNKSILFVPVTTRTIIQYSRIEFGILPRYSLCANGGVLLENGIQEMRNKKHLIFWKRIKEESLNVEIFMNFLFLQNVIVWSQWCMILKGF